MDFEEFLWAKGYQGNQVEDILGHMKETVPFSGTELPLKGNEDRSNME